MRVAYVNCELNGTVVVCTIGTNGLTPVQTLLAYPEEFAGRDHPQNYGKADYWGAEAVITANGEWYVYVCRVDQSLAVFSVNPDNGHLVLKHRAPLAEHSNARNLDLYEDPTAGGKLHLLVASQDADLVEVFELNPEDGTVAKKASATVHCAADVAVV